MRGRGLTESSLDSVPHILAADDNELNRKVIERQLDKLGVRAHLVTSGAQAVAAFETGQYTLVFMDVKMIDMDGYAATRAIREREEESRVPIIAITANDDFEEHERCLDAGMDDVLTKPIRLRELAKLMVRWGAYRPESKDGAARDEPGSQPGAAWLEHLEAASGQAGLKAEIIEEFLERAPAHLRRLKQALEQGQADRAARERFALVMNSRGLGALRLAEVTAELGLTMTPEEQEQGLALIERELALVAGALVPDGL